MRNLLTDSVPQAEELDPAVEFAIAEVEFRLQGDVEDADYVLEVRQALARLSATLDLMRYRIEGRAPH